MRILGQISPGLEELGAEELRRLGATSVSTVYKGVFLETDPAGAMRMNYLSRLFDRFLLPVGTFSCGNSDQFYRKALAHPWEKLLSVQTTFAISASVSGGRIRHSQWAALRLKDAIADRFRNMCGRRPSVDRDDPDVAIDLRVRGARAEIRLDLSGGALHRRGYRVETVKAPMRETIAAAALEMSEWNGEKPLVDPMCGSGTLLCEALIKHCSIPPGYLRKKWGFFRMPGYSPGLWKKVKARADSRMTSLPHDLLQGSDISHNAVLAAGANLQRLPQGDRVKILRRDWRESEGYSGVLILTNPPHGKRIYEETAGNLLGEFGDFLKNKCTGSEACLYLGDTKLLKKVGLRTSWRKPLVSGGLEGRLARYELY